MNIQKKMTPTISKQNIWAEDLPEKCPPKDAVQPSGKILYRVIRYNPPRQDDFDSQRKLNPNKFFNDISECRARSLSVFDSLEKCRKLLKMARFKGCLVAELQLPSDSGVISQTGQKGHFSWWRRKNFDPLTNGHIIIL